MNLLIANAEESESISCVCKMHTLANYWQAKLKRNAYDPRDHNAVAKIVFRPGDEVVGHEVRVISAVYSLLIRYHRMVYCMNEIPYENFQVVATLLQPWPVRLSQVCGILCKVFTTLQGCDNLYNGCKMIVEIVKLHSTSS